MPDGAGRAGAGAPGAPDRSGGAGRAVAPEPVRGAGGGSLGLPLAGPPIGVFSLFRLPLGAFRPNDLLYVYESEGRLGGPVADGACGPRDEWTIVELDAIGLVDAGDIRFRLVQACFATGRSAVPSAST